MKIQTMTAAAAMLVGGAAICSGCASTPGKAASRGGATEMTANAGSAYSPMLHDASGSMPEAIHYTPKNHPISALGGPAAPTMTGRTASLIGLYGEFVGANPEAGTQYDGGVNMLQVTTASDGACFDPTCDRTGAWLAFASTMHRKTADIYMKSTQGKTLTQVTNDPADDVMPAFSPDGKNIAFASNRTGNWDIYTVSIDGLRTMQVTSDVDHELHPTWSPDGRMIAYCKFGSQSMRWELWAVDVANPGMKHFLEYGLFPTWSPDPGRNKIMFQRAKQRGSRDYSVWTIDYVNGQAMYPTEIVSAANAALINPAWSPDGGKIVFVSVVDPDQSPGARPGQSDLWIVNVDGSSRQSLTNGLFANFQPVWAGNGTVFFVSDRSGVDNIWAVRTSTRGVEGPGMAAADVTGGRMQP